MLKKVLMNKEVESNPYSYVKSSYKVTDQTND